MLTELTGLMASLFLALQAQPAEAPAPKPDPAAEAAPEEAVNDEDKIVCRRTAITGSKFKKKVCATKKEWASLGRRSRENAGEMQRRGKGLSPNGS